MVYSVQITSFHNLFNIVFTNQPCNFAGYCLDFRKFGLHSFEYEIFLPVITENPFFFLKG